MSIFRDILEGIFDTDIFKEFSNKYKGKDLPKLTDEEKAETDEYLAYPCALPFNDDGTLEAWLLRISLWGRISIRWINPEEGIDKSITNDEFLDEVDDQKRNKAYGKWNVEELDVNKIEFNRKFWSIEGKEIVEKLIVLIDLRSDLKKKLKQLGRY